jgi:hypothetical protein
MIRSERCSGCGLVLAGGATGCRELFNGRVARETSDFRYARVHRVVVDCYCLQHPEQYCISAKSLIAHLCGLCIALEHASDQAAYRALQRSLDGNPRLDKARSPELRGTLTIAEVLAAPDAIAYSRAVDAWAHSVWQAYTPLHGAARAWLQASFPG